MKGGQDGGLNQTMWYVHLCSLNFCVFHFVPMSKTWLCVNCDNILRHDSIYFILGWFMAFYGYGNEL